MDHRTPERLIQSVREMLQEVYETLEVALLVVTHDAMASVRAVVIAAVGKLSRHRLQTRRINGVVCGADHKSWRLDGGQPVGALPVG